MTDALWHLLTVVFAAGAVYAGVRAELKFHREKIASLESTWREEIARLQALARADLSRIEGALSAIHQRIDDHLDSTARMLKLKIGNPPG